MERRGAKLVEIFVDVLVGEIATYEGAIDDAVRTGDVLQGTRGFASFKVVE